MNMIINHMSMDPIYEQIIAQIKAQIIDGTLEKGAVLPSVRTLAKELKISALTVKKAYDLLEEEGLIVTVHGKGSFVAEASQSQMQEARQKETEADLEEAVRKGRMRGLTDEEIRTLFNLIMEE